ncbi:MAG: transposase [Rhodospirillaceae bacterium]|nr:transposase [Rhodospirillaceae bacterium]
MALIERGGDMRMFPMPDQKHSTMRSIVRLNVDDTAHIVSDGHPAYRKMPPYFASHDWVDHSRREIVRGIIHVNFAESCFSLLKRSIIGVHHHVSKQHMSKYLRNMSSVGICVTIRMVKEPLPQSRARRGNG